MLTTCLHLYFFIVSLCFVPVVDRVWAWGCFTSAAKILTFGVPLKQYSECNSWGDKLGDLVKLKVWGSSSSSSSSSTGSARADVAAVSSDPAT